MTGGLLDKGIAIIIMLFILSMISERFVNWIKLQFGKRGSALPGFSTRNEDLTVRNPDCDLEKRREQKILGLNIVIGFIIAIASHADLFQIVQQDSPYATLGWPSLAGLGTGDALLKVVSAIPGCLLTGFFISLGSKFWHDLLDLLLYTKNLKQKLSSPETYEVESVDELDEYLKFTESDMVNMAIDQNESVLKHKFPNIHFINNSVTILKGKRTHVVRIYVQDTNTAGMPQSIPVRLTGSNKIYNVPVDTVTGSTLGKAAMALDGTLADDNSPDYLGSGCCLARRDTDVFVVTACHVMTQGSLEDPLTKTGNDDVQYNGNVVGQWTYGSMDNEGDFALVKLSDPENFADSVQAEQFGNRFRTIDMTKDYLQPVKVRGNVNSNGTGYIIDVVAKKTGIEYNNGKILIFDTVILVGNQPNKDICGPACAQGDSGGVVFDGQNQLIGVIAGLTPRFSIILPIDKKANDLNLKII